MSGQVPSEGLLAARPAFASALAKKCASTETRAARSFVQRSTRPDIPSVPALEPTKNVAGNPAPPLAGKVAPEPQIAARRSGQLETFSTGSVASAFASAT